MSDLIPISELLSFKKGQAITAFESDRVEEIAADMYSDDERLNTFYFETMIEEFKSFKSKILKWLSLNDSSIKPTDQYIWDYFYPNYETFGDAIEITNGLMFDFVSEFNPNSSPRKNIETIAA